MSLGTILLGGKADLEADMEAYLHTTYACGMKMDDDLCLGSWPLIWFSLLPINTTDRKSVV